MQTQLPFFPSTTQYLNPILGVFEKDGMIFYLHNGSPLYCHDRNDRNSYRYITANLVLTGLCKPSEISSVFGVSSRSVQMNVKNLREKGAEYFFRRIEKRGQCYKLDDKAIMTAQEQINLGKSVQATAQDLGVTEAALRYHIRNGRLKKKQKLNQL